MLYVLNSHQVNPKTMRFVNDHGMKNFTFLVDSDHKVIDQYGIYNDHPEQKFETGVPHPTTYLLDRDGKILLKDTRKDFTIWLSSAVLRDKLASSKN